MAILGQHVDLVVELIEQLLADVRVEDLLDGDIQVEVLSFMDGAEPSHRYLLPHVQVSHL